MFSFTFFFTAAHFHLALVAAGISRLVTAVTKFLLIELFYIGMPLVWTDGRSGGRAYVITKFFSEGKITSFSYPRCSAGRLRASSKTRLVHVIVFIFIENRSLVLNENGYLN